MTSTLVFWRGHAELSFGGAARSISAVSPPPGVSVTEMVAAHRLDEAAGDRKAEANADAGVVVAEPLERSEQLLLGASRYARPLVDDGDQHAAADLTRGYPHRAVRCVAQRVCR